MINSDRFFTIVFKDLTKDERVELLNNYQEKFSASSYSHAMDDRDQLLGALSYAECALGDIGDAAALPHIRKLLLAHGKTITTMADQRDPNTPTDEMVSKWIEDWAEGQMKGPVTEDQRVVATQAARWGADQELQACLEHLFRRGFSDADLLCLRATRRPKPPSLKAQALDDLDSIQTHDQEGREIVNLSNIRLALEALPND